MEIPLEVVVDKVIDDPGFEPIGAWGNTWLESLLCHLDKSELLFVDVSAASRRTWRQVVYDGTNVTLGPCQPLQGDVRTGFDCDIFLARER